MSSDEAMTSPHGTLHRVEPRSRDMAGAERSIVIGRARCNYNLVLAEDNPRAVRRCKFCFPVAAEAGSAPNVQETKK